MKINIRLANHSDLERYYRWAKDPEVRKQSFNQNEVTFEEHSTWFNTKLSDLNTKLYVFENELNEVLGQLRFQLRDGEYVVGLNVDADHRGKGYASEIVKLGTFEFMKTNPKLPLIAYIKKTNQASFHSFEKAGYTHLGELIMHGGPVNKMSFLIKNA